MKTRLLLTVRLFLVLTLFSTSITLVQAYDPDRIPRPRAEGTDQLPEGWRFEDIGPIRPPSDWCYNAEEGQYYIKASGREVFGSPPDEFGFIYFETSEDKQITARIMDAEVNTGQGAPKGFIMIRSGLEGDDQFVYLEVKTHNNNRVCLCWREQKGSSSTGSVEEPSGTVGSTFDPPNCYPRWIRFVRQGLYCTGYHRDDVEGAAWKQLGQVRKLTFKGSAYMGIGVSAACYASTTTTPAIMIFDNLAVEEIDVPYYTLYPASVENTFNLPVKPGLSKDIDVTKVFGHALGEYFTITAEVTDRSIAEVYVHEKPASTDYQNRYGEEFVKYLNVKGLREGVTTVRLYCTINGFSMQADYSLNVSDGKRKPRNDLGTVPYGWDLINLSIPIDPNLIWGQEFVTRTAPMVTNASIFFGAWEYDWGGTGTGHFASTPGNDAPAPSNAVNVYVKDAIKYTFREELINYKKLKETSTYPNPTTGVITSYMRNWFANWYTGKDTTVYDKVSSVDLAFLPANAKTDSALYSAERGHDFFTVSRDNNGPLWETGQGFWTERLGTYDGQKVRGFPFVTNVQAGDWLAYTVTTQRRGKYRIVPVTAQTDEKLSLRFDINGVMQVKELSLGKATSPSAWSLQTGADVELDEGKNQIKVIFNSGGINFLGFKLAFISSAQEVYSAVNYDTVKYVQPERYVDTSQMAPGEIEDWKELVEQLEEGGLTDSQKYAIDSIIKTYPYKLIFDNAKVINHYKDELEELGVEVGNSPQDTLNALEIVRKELTTTIDSVEFVTTQQTLMKHIDGTSYLYKMGIDPTKKVEVTMKVDSLSNAGRATYAGIMLRPVGENLQGEKELLSNSPFISFAVGSYEGGRFSYRWDYNMDTKKLDDESLAQDIYLKVRLNEYDGYVTAYYSYDNLFWWEYLKDPLRMGFFGDEEDITVGMVLTGGSFANEATMAALRARDFEIKEFENGEEFEDLDYAEEMVDLPLIMSSTDVREGTPVDISFNINKPGLVSLEIYNTYGVMIESIRSNQYMPFNKDKVTVPHTIGNLGKTGIYMLRLDAPENVQYLRFRYTE